MLLHFTSIGATDDELGIQAWEAVKFLPGKAWLLWDCCPIRYKSGTDFEAQGGQVSIAELEVQPWAVSEFSLLTPV